MGRKKQGGILPVHIAADEWMRILFLLPAEKSSVCTLFFIFPCLKAVRLANGSVISLLCTRASAKQERGAKAAAASALTAR